MKIQIKTYWGSLLFEHELKGNSIKKTLLEAIRRGADLRGAYLRGADLRGAYLRGADLRGADLRGADLRGAYLIGADLRGAYLIGADLRGAYLRGAYLRGAYLIGAYLIGADLRGAYLRGADLRKIESLFKIVPEEGSFIAWKKGAGQHLIKLEIPEKAKRHNAIGGRKCRAEFVKVLDIRNSKGHKVKKCNGKHDHGMVYEIGKITRPDSYNPDPLRECLNGIHFFLTKQEAKDY